MIGATLDGHDAIAQKFGRMRRTMLGIAREVAFVQFQKDVLTIQRKYRSKASVGPSGTRVVSGALRASYSATANIIGQTAMVAEIGLLRLRARGQALIYGRVWEGLTDKSPGRPPGGAIAKVTRTSLPMIQREIERRWLAAVG